MGAVGADVADLAGGELRLATGGAAYYNDGETTVSKGAEVDLHVKVDGFHLLAEYIWDHASPTAQPATSQTIPVDVTRMMAAGEVGYLLAERTLGVTARAEWVDDNSHFENTGDFLAITGGIQYYWHAHHLKAQLDYCHRQELEGESLDNDSLIFQLQLAP